MTNLLFAILAAVIVALTLRAGWLFIRLYIARYEAYRAHAEAFYDAADRLIDNSNTPDDVVSFVDEMNGTINSPYAAMMFSFALRKGRRANSSSPQRKPRFDLREMPQDVVADFVIAFDHWVEAMAYRGMGWGPVFKAYLDAPTIEEKAKSIAEKSHQRDALPAMP